MRDLTLMHVPADIIEAAAALDGPRRHKERVAATIQAFESFATERLDAAGVDTHDCGIRPHVRAVAAIYMALDAAGVGGLGGVSGGGTARLEPGRTLGKGRKHASDGAAWMAALSDARQQMPRVHVIFTPSTVEAVVREGMMEIGEDDFRLVLPLWEEHEDHWTRGMSAWCRSLAAQEAVRQAFAARNAPQPAVPIPAL